MVNFIKTNIFGVLISSLFFLMGILTISHYGINIDEPAHFIRGQAYLKYLTTGQKHYSMSDLQGKRITVWRYEQFDPEHFLNIDSGHPALNDILAATTNSIFFEKLGILGDLESYHLFEIFISTIGIFFVYLFVKEFLGEFSGVVAGLSMLTYPLFYGESHFNIKDPVLTAFFILTIYFFYHAVNRVSAKLFLISAFFFALAFSTKFNIVFLPLILFTYIVVRFMPNFKQTGIINSIKKIPLRIILSLLAWPLIILTIYYLSRPYFWDDPINRFFEIVKYYKDIGTGIFPDNRFLLHGWNIYPLFFIFVSTPPVIIFLSVIGIVCSFFNFGKDKYKLTLLFFLWLLIPVLRVSLPGSSIYNGIRQIMEFIPALAAFSGIGAFYIHKLISKFTLVPFSYLIIILMFIPLIITLFTLHPNENMYMNFLIGGLKGAYHQNIPGAAESMGNVYLQGIWWLNKNAEKDAKFGLPVGLASNVPQEFLRNDIAFGPYFSGSGQQGEYMIEKISIGFPPQHILSYNFRYLETYLIPEHEIKVGGVTVLKIWKNDKQHVKKEYLNEKEVTDFVVNKGSGFSQIEFNKPEQVVRIEIDHDDKNCLARIDRYVTPGYVSFSKDGGQNEIIFGDLMFSQGPFAMSFQSYTRFVYFMLGDTAKWIKIVPSDPRSCLLKENKIRIFSRVN